MIYVYKCDECRKQFEVQMKLEDYKQEVPCKYCNKPMVKQLQSLPFRMN